MNKISQNSNINLENLLDFLLEEVERLTVEKKNNPHEMLVKQMDIEIGELKHKLEI